MAKKRYLETSTVIYRRLHDFGFDQSAIMVILDEAEERGLSIPEVEEISDAEAEYLLQEGYKRWSAYQSNVG